MGVLRFPLSKLTPGNTEIYNNLPLVSRAEADAEAAAEAAAAEAAAAAAAAAAKEEEEEGKQGGAGEGDAGSGSSSGVIARTSGDDDGASTASSQPIISVKSMSLMSKSKRGLGTVSFTIKYR